MRLFRSEQAAVLRWAVLQTLDASNTSIVLPCCRRSGQDAF